jgi:hypothetical protein
MNRMRDMKTYWPTVISVLVLTASVGLVMAQTQVQIQPDRLKPFMQRKLDLSKNVLEALALEDFEQLAKNSQGLSLLSLESGWNVLTTEEYKRQSDEFRRAAQVITESAREKNLDRAALAFVNMTVRCVECHKYMRRSHPEVKRLK